MTWCIPHATCITCTPQRDDLGTVDKHRTNNDLNKEEGAAAAEEAEGEVAGAAVVNRFL